MSAPMEEAVFHELKKVRSGVGFAERRGFYGKRGDASLHMLMLNRVSWAVGFTCRKRGRFHFFLSTMPKIKTSRTKKAPEGFEEIEPVGVIHRMPIRPYTDAPPSKILDDYGRKMRDAENESHEGKRKSESLWPIMRISHARSRYIYELYYKREAISKELYDWLLKEKYADAKQVQEDPPYVLLD
jgi:G10 protein